MKSEPLVSLRFFQDCDFSASTVIRYCSAERQASFSSVVSLAQAKRTSIFEHDSYLNVLGAHSDHFALLTIVRVCFSISHFFCLSVSAVFQRTRVSNCVHLVCSNIGGAVSPFFRTMP